MSVRENKGITSVMIYWLWNYVFGIVCIYLLWLSCTKWIHVHFYVFMQLFVENSCTKWIHVHFYVFSIWMHLFWN